MRDGDVPLEAGGAWWVPAAPDLRVGGRLQYRNCQPFLSLDGGLPGIDFDQRELGPLTIHGLSQGRPLTLHRAFVQSMQGGLDGVHSAGLHVERVIVGDHIDPETHTFQTVRLCLTHLDDWVVDGENFKLDFGEPNTVILRHPSPNPQAAQLATPTRGTISLLISGQPSGMGFGMRSVSIHQRATLQVELDEAATMDDL